MAYRISCVVVRLHNDSRRSLFAEIRSRTQSEAHLRRSRTGADPSPTPVPRDLGKIWTVKSWQPMAIQRIDLPQIASYCLAAIANHWNKPFPLSGRAVQEPCFGFCCDSAI